MISWMWGFVVKIKECLRFGSDLNNPVILCSLGQKITPFHSSSQSQSSPQTNRQLSPHLPAPHGVGMLSFNQNLWL